MTRWKSGRETILCDREEEEWNREEQGEKESERPAPTRQLSWYSMTSNNSQKLSTTERVIKSKQHKYFSYNRDREWYIVVYDIRCQLGFVRVSVRAILTCVYVCMALRPRLFRLPRSVRQFTLAFLDLHSFSSLSVLFVLFGWILSIYATIILILQTKCRIAMFRKRMRNK